MPIKNFPSDEYTVFEYPFSGIVRNHSKPNINFNPSDFAELYNARYVPGGAVMKRTGETDYDANGAAGANRISGIFQFNKENESENHFIIQSEDESAYSKLYEANNEPSPGGTGNIDATTLYSGSATGYGFGHAVNFNDEFIFTDGLDLPQIWPGTSPLCDGFKKTKNSENIWIDYLVQVTDNLTTTSANLNSLTTAANGSYFYVGYRRPIEAVIFTMGNTNDTASVLSGYYWDGGSWTEVGSLSDGTDVAGDTLKKTGTVSFDSTVSTAKQKLIDGLNLYWYRFQVTVALDSSVTVTKCEVTSPMQDIVDLWDGKYRLVDGFLHRDGSAGAAFKDLLANVIDDVSSTTSSISALTPTQSVTGSFNLTINGDFTSDTTDWTANNSTIASVAGGQAGNCLEITRVSGTKQWAAATQTGMITGNNYRLQCYVKSKSSGDEAFLLEVYSILTGNQIAATSGTTTTSWVQKTLYFELDYTSVEIRLTKNTVTAGTMIFDGLTLVQAEPDWLYLGAEEKPKAFRLEIDSATFNNNTATIDWEYWDGDAWSDVSSESDGTASGGATLAQTGNIDFFEAPSDAEKRVLAGQTIPLYWFRLQPSAACDNVNVQEVRYVPDLTVTDKWKYVTEFKDRVVYGNKVGLENSIFIAAYLQSGGMSGSDSLEIQFAGGAVQAQEKYYNELFVGTKEHLFLIEGYSPDTYGKLRIPGKVGVWAPDSVKVIPYYPTDGGMKSVVMFVARDGIYYFDGIKAVKVWQAEDDMQEYWNGINTARIDDCYAEYFPGTREYFLQVSYGSSQTTHNRTIVINCRNGGVSIFDWAFACLRAVKGSSDEDMIYGGDYNGYVSECYDGTYSTAILGGSALKYNGYVKTVDNDFGGVLVEKQSRGIGVVAKAETSVCTLEGFIDGATSASEIDDDTNTSKTVTLTNSGYSMKIGNVTDIAFNFSTIAWKFSNNVINQGFTLYRRMEMVRSVRLISEAY